MFARYTNASGVWREVKEGTWSNSGSSQGDVVNRCQSIRCLLAVCRSGNHFIELVVVVDDVIVCDPNFHSSQTVRPLCGLSCFRLSEDLSVVMLPGALQLFCSKNCVPRVQRTSVEGEFTVLFLKVRLSKPKTMVKTL